MTRLALKKHPTYDVIIVPGIQFVEPQWDRVLQMRLLWAKHLYDRGLTKYIMTSGSSVYTPYTEAVIMADYLVAMGVPREYIITEERAEHSTENLWYGFKLAQKHGFSRIALATDPFQSKMLYGFAKRHTHRQVKFLPVIMDTLQTIAHLNPNINYTQHKILNFIPITQRQSKWKRFKGTMGKNIDFSE
jgi:hypothetical protein